MNCKDKADALLRLAPIPVKLESMFNTTTTFTISEITAHIKTLMESDMTLQSAWVTGEVSNMTRAASGHWYFTLKDSGSQLKCVMWRSSASKQNTVPQDGDAIEAHGYVSLYEPRGEYQLVADRVRPVGMGDLYARFEELKARLQAEGLFDPERKRPIPVFPLRIGVVTSPDAAAFQDIQNVLRRRFPLGEIILSPTPVQGVDAPLQIVRALERLNVYGASYGVDVILLIRGGGSIEDLWSFNDERVARAVAASAIPIVSGVGHETDFTIVDFVSDFRAPTPSAAAEVVTPHIDALREAVARADGQLTDAIREIIDRWQNVLGEMQGTMRYTSPLGYITTMRQRIDSLDTRMMMRQRGRLALLQERLNGRGGALEAANPAAILARGYAIVRDADGVALKSAAQTAPGDALVIQLYDGAVDVRVTNGDESAPDLTRRKKRDEQDPDGDEDGDDGETYQRSLF